MNGIDIIAAERAKQKDLYSLEHDQEHTDGSLLQAASCYLRHARTTIGVRIDGNCDEVNFTRALRDPEWPWEIMSFKPNPENPIADLARVGAFCAAEIDRLLAHPKLQAVENKE